ncbi:scavenger receptor class F member 1 [Pyxicephalus adspersus]|uniref:scavenger receptor class F member 1 n=1 Tax=Pyxicephalus adspersus TaxID=30357 RepID=UPI003B5C13D4
MLIHTTKLRFMVLFWTWLPGLNSQDLDPNGQNVCISDSVTKALVCCPGWKQEGRACTAAICEGADECKQDEVCIRPGVCRCKPGYFGADCNSPCPDQYWGSDCKKRCSCYPNGKCDGVTGQCICYPNRWGPDCQHTCHCNQHGTCDPLTGSCQCEPGWWAQHCNKPCLCNLETSHCNQTNGQCVCNIGWWGQRCGIKCNCNKSPCLQTKGICKCREGWHGPRCESQCDCVHGKCSQNGECDCHIGYQGKRCAEPCIPGTYGPKCEKSCGKCKQGQACSPVDGFCSSCEPGWNGTRCETPCLTGYYGENCAQICPKCRANEVCSPGTGTCQNCDPGRMGPRCEFSCPEGSYGERCQHLCPLCIHGICDPVTGDCVCDLGHWKPSCNETCPHGFFGSNCSSPCECDGGPCNPMYGTCLLTSSQKGAIIAGVLVPMCLLFILCCCCCCFCGNNQMDSKHSVSNGDEGCLLRMKHNFQGALVNISSLLPCCSVGNNKVSWVTVSHHDAELPFNHSFIESPSTGWISENSFSSFETDEEGPVYCVPPREGVSVADLDGFQEISSKCNVFPEAMVLNAEEGCLPFSIPRTSSIAKAKRPSVSFAEGTKFESRRSSTTDTPNLARKPKLAISLPKLPSIQSQTPNANNSQHYEDSTDLYDKVSPNLESEDHPKLQRCAPAGRRRTMSNAQKPIFKAESTDSGLKDISSEAKKKSHNLTTVYVSVGPPRKPYKPRRRSEGNMDGAVQAVLKRFGSFQKGIPKPVRKSLLQHSNSKLSQIKSTFEEDLNTTNKVSLASKLQDNTTKKSVIEKSSILRKNIPEDGHGSERTSNSGKPENMYSNLQEPLPMQQALNSEHIYQSPDEGEDSEPKYENVTIPKSFTDSEPDPASLYEDAQLTCETPSS